MNYLIKKVDFEISNFSTMSTNIINANLLIHCNEQILTYKIINYIGKGTVGQVYLLESLNNSGVCVIKISNSQCIEDLLEESNLLEKYFTKNSIEHPSYPIYFGYFKNLNGVGVIYPYFGFYNLEKIKLTTYKIGFKYNLQIITQIIKQLNNLKNIIHCDLKPSNVAINVDNSNITATIIDFGLIREKTCLKNVISTNYITSPESLLTLLDFQDCRDLDEPLNLDKHDYFGLFSIVINLFIKKSFWEFMCTYLTDINFNRDSLYKQKASYIFVYVWFRFFYENKEQIKNKNLFNIIQKIELIYPNIAVKNFMNYNDFFSEYIIKNINLNTINNSNLNDLKEFTISIIQFDYQLRPTFDELQNHKFLN